MAMLRFDFNLWFWWLKQEVGVDLRRARVVFKASFKDSVLSLSKCLLTRENRPFVQAYLFREFWGISY